MTRDSGNRERAPRKDSPLAGKGIVITRPAAQAGRLAALIEAAGGVALLFPSIEISGVADSGPLDALIARLHEFDLAVFVSPNAAQMGMARIRARRELPANLALAAVGPGSARELAALGCAAVLSPAGRGDSESLLALPQLGQPRGMRVVIFRGDGGRELLADTLAARGAQVEYATCYRRTRPALDPAPLIAAWRRGALDAVTATSSEGLRNFCEMVGAAGTAYLVATPVIVPHPRIAQAARELGITRVLVASEPGDEGVVAALTEYFGER